MASVWLAHDRHTRSEVALKVLFDHLRDDALVVERFRREVTAARRVVHPNVVPIFELVETPQCLALVQEYFPAIDLKRLIRREGRLRPDRVMRIVGQILDALETAHHHGVVHRDIKPHNVLVNAEDNVKLVDFGLAGVDDMIGLTSHTMSVGTPEYMAPELADSTTADGRADLYGLGILMYESLTGRLPYTAPTAIGVLRQHTEGEPPDVRDHIDSVRPHVVDAIKKAMQPIPEDRFATAADMRNALRGLLLERQDEPRTIRICQNCGEPWVSGFGACLSCGYRRVSFDEDGEAFVYMLRRGFYTGDDGRDLTYEEKHALAAALDALGGRCRFAEARTDRLLDNYPVPIASNLTQRDAELVARELSELGLPVRVVKGGVLGELFKIAKFSDPIWWAKILTVTAILLGWVAYMIVLSDWRYGLAMGGGVFVLWLFRTMWRMRPIWTFERAEGHVVTDDTLLREATAAYRQLRSARSKALIRRILQRALLIREHFEDEDESAHDIHLLVETALRAASRMARVEEVLYDLNQRELHEQMAALDEKIEYERNVHTVDDLIREKNRLHQALVSRDDAEHEFARLTNQLLAAYSQLDTLVVRVETMEDAQYDNVSVVLHDVSAQLESQREVREVVTA